MKPLLLMAASCAVLCAQESAQVREAVRAVTQERIGKNLTTLVGFGERNARTDPNNPDRPIAQAERWLVRELQSYNPRMEVRVSEWPGDLVLPRVRNVIATLPGKVTPEKYVLVTAHYDSMGGPGAADNGSGTVAMLEVARVLSRMEFPKTLVFVAFSGEEGGLVGSSHEAAKAAEDNLWIEAVLNADIVGNGPTVGDDGIPTLDLYAGSDRSAISAKLGTYIRHVGEWYTPLLINVKYAQDRQGRRSDHISYWNHQFPAVRFVSPYEELEVQHTPRDTIEKVSIKYTAMSAQVMASVAASLALGLADPY